MTEHVRSMDKWLKWAVILAPMVSGVVFGTAGYIGGYLNARADIQVTANRVALVEGWKDKQEEFNKTIIRQIATLNAIVKVQ